MSQLCEYNCKNMSSNNTNESKDIVDLKPTRNKKSWRWLKKFFVFLCSCSFRLLHILSRKLSQPSSHSAYVL